MTTNAAQHSEDRLAEATGAAMVAGLTALRAAGDAMAKKHGYRSVKGLDAVKFHLMMTHHWLPSAINAMSVDDLVFAIGEELVRRHGILRAALPK